MKMNDLDSHPVFSKSFTVQTDAIAEASNEALDAIFMRQTGLIFYGMSRVGKTRCIIAIKRKLSGFMPRAYITQIEVMKKEGSHTNNIIEQIATEEGLPFASKMLAVSKLTALIDTILFRCIERSCNHWVLLIDEFQKLRVYDMSLLSDMFNRLERKGVTMTVLSFGMNSVKRQRDDLKTVPTGKIDSAQLIARFMSRLILFKGCTNVSDLETILRAYDRDSEYPTGSQISYTAGFLPAAFANGFRLESYSRDLWKSLNSATAGGYKNNVPLEHVFLSLRYLIRYLVTLDADKITLPPHVFDEVVRKSNLHEFCAENGYTQ
ncbi:MULTISPECIES: hypothetical protein [unclassified Pseudomonas]|uniref:hypothetical protein n=1 Tax=unclassified Pseudomonas TaxID=196821 RepID=UPI000D37267C|nr:MULTISPECIES: hypothetical protein [unclassified Pseudomonas]RAU48000.1 hypothetical protein DBP26_005540 [Pseudomonas sp. RIT 409]RAU55306.1 hypothetical protein DBY65_005125 [Pseudomonas sp. RIT 412]